MARPFAKIQLLIKPSTIISNDEDNSQQVWFYLNPFFVLIHLFLVNISSFIIICRYSFTSSIDSNRYWLFIPCCICWTTSWSNKLLYNITFSFTWRSFNTISSLCRYNTYSITSRLCKCTFNSTNWSWITKTK
jgi:hypothetical protein